MNGLIGACAETFERLVRTGEPDSVGGVRAVWTPGEPFRAALVAAGERPSVAGLRERPDGRYVMWAEGGAFFRPGEVVRRAADGAAFRALSRSRPAPPGAGLHVTRTTVEGCDPL